jgi:hypothetical protein
MNALRQVPEGRLRRFAHTYYTVSTGEVNIHLAIERVSADGASSNPKSLLLRFMHTVRYIPVAMNVHLYTCTERFLSSPVKND